MSRAVHTEAPALPLKVSAAEADSIFEQISVIALSASGLAAQAVEQAGGNLALVEKTHGVQKLIELIGALADSATTSSSRGTLGNWLYGSRS